MVYMRGHLFERYNAYQDLTPSPICPGLILILILKEAYSKICLRCTKVHRHTQNTLAYSCLEASIMCNKLLDAALHPVV